jgi:hypothetical protein
LRGGTLVDRVIVEKRCSQEDATVATERVKERLARKGYGDVIAQMQESDGSWKEEQMMTKMQKLILRCIAVAATAEVVWKVKVETIDGADAKEMTESAIREGRALVVSRTPCATNEYCITAGGCLNWVKFREPLDHTAKRVWARIQELVRSRVLDKELKPALDWLVGALSDQVTPDPALQVTFVATGAAGDLRLVLQQVVDVLQKVQLEKTKRKRPLCLLNAGDFTEIDDSLAPAAVDKWDWKLRMWLQHTSNDMTYRDSAISEVKKLRSERTASKAVVAVEEEDRLPSLWQLKPLRELLRGLPTYPTIVVDAYGVSKDVIEELLQTLAALNGDDDDERKHEQSHWTYRSSEEPGYKPRVIILCDTTPLGLISEQLSADFRFRDWHRLCREVRDRGSFSAYGCIAQQNYSYALEDNEEMGIRFRFVHRFASIRLAQDTN